jgi:hypothetical protein
MGAESPCLLTPLAVALTSRFLRALGIGTALAHHSSRSARPVYCSCMSPPLEVLHHVRLVTHVRSSVALNDCAGLKTPSTRALPTLNRDGVALKYCECLYRRKGHQTALRTLGWPRTDTSSAKSLVTGVGNYLCRRTASANVSCVALCRQVLQSYPCSSPAHRQRSDMAM